MFTKIVKYLDEKLNVQPQSYRPAEVLEAFKKVDRILETAWMPSHVDVAEAMMVYFVNRYGFTDEQRSSPLVVAMQERINSKRESIGHDWSDKYA